MKNLLGQLDQLKKQNPISIMAGATRKSSNNLQVLQSGSPNAKSEVNDDTPAIVNELKRHIEI